MYLLDVANREMMELSGSRLRQTQMLISSKRCAGRCLRQ